MITGKPAPLQLICVGLHQAVCGLSAVGPARAFTVSETTVRREIPLKEVLLVQPNLPRLLLFHTGLRFRSTSIPAVVDKPSMKL